MTDEGTMEEYLEILINHNKDGLFRISQPFLIDRVIHLFPVMKDARIAYTSVVASKFLTKDEEGKCRKEDWSYRSVIRIPRSLVNYTHPKISFFSAPMYRLYEQAEGLLDTY